MFLKSSLGVHIDDAYFIIFLSSQFHHFMSRSLLLVFSSNLYLMILAGTPPIIAYGGTSFVTTAPAAITAPSPTVMPGSKLTFAPIHTSFPMTIGELSAYCSIGLFSTINPYLS